MTIDELKADLEDGDVRDIGEDGACAVWAKTQMEAVLALRAYVCVNVDHQESEDVTAETVVSAWATLPTDKEREDAEEYEYEWLLSHTYEGADRSVPVWYYDPHRL